MNNEEAKVVERKEFKLKYPILKKEGYVLEYGSKEKDYLDIYLKKKIDDVSSFSLRIYEGVIMKKLVSSGTYDDKIQPLTWKEIKGINEIISQLA